MLTVPDLLVIATFELVPRAQCLGSLLSPRLGKLHILQSLALLNHAGQFIDIAQTLNSRFDTRTSFLELLEDIALGEG